MLLDEIGGPLRQEFSDQVNTCAIRVSDALNKSGAMIRRTGNVVIYKGRDEKLFVVGVPAMKLYLTRIYGVGREIYTKNKYDTHVAKMNTQGIVLFEWQGKIADFGATGHVDLVRINRGVLACEGKCYFIVGPMKAYLWETNP